MKKNMKFFLGLFLGLIVSGITAYAVIKCQANEIGYGNGTVESALNDLYTKPTVKKVCRLKDTTYGTAGNVGSMYECDPGDGTTRNFYILTANNNTVDLIMDRNITNEISWNDAMAYFRTGAGVQIKNSWADVLDIDLPKAQALADAAGNPNFIAATSGATCWCLGNGQTGSSCGTHTCSATDIQKSRAWLYNNLTNCISYGCSVQDNSASEGYWSRDLLSGYAYAWIISYVGSYNNRVKTSAYGLRPVITVLKSNLYTE